MTDYKTLRVPADAYEAARAAKRETETWGEFLQRCSETRPEIREFVEATDADADAERIAQIVTERIEGSKPLEEMAFDDWFEKDHAQTVALQIVEELEGLDLAFESDDLREQLDRIEAAASSAEDRAGSIEQTLDRMGGR